MLFRSNDTATTEIYTPSNTLSLHERSSDLPRTSPDHGTALDIAGRGIANPSSFIEALLLCRQIAARDRARADRLPNEGQRPEYRSSARPSLER